MLTNKIVLTINGITAVIVVPVQIVTTFVLGILAQVTFGLLLIPLSLIWIVFFYGPILGFSYVYERIVIFRPLVSIIGIPLAVFGSIYVALIPSMGEMESRVVKLLLCETFPYTWTFHRYSNRTLGLNDYEGVFEKILRQVSYLNPAYKKYLDGLELDMLSKS